MRPRHPKLYRAPFIAITYVALLLATGCQGVGDLELSKIGRRAAWQRPELVIETLAIQPGDRVADIGAGHGYFLGPLSEAVGPEGVVYAVEVDPEVVADLEALVVEQQLGNVEVVLGEYTDPNLPDLGVDLVFLCNTYHHIEDRPDYFARIRADLRPGGRVAIIDPDEDGSGILHWLKDDGHWTGAAALSEEMSSAGYAASASHDFLPVQIFAVFAPK